MSKVIIGSVVGSVVGLGFGCLIGAGRAAVTVCCPVLWIPGSAIGCGGMAHSLGASPVMTGVATVAGAGLGVVELALYPVMAPLSLVEAACLPAVGTVAGAVVGGFIGKDQ